MELLTLQIFGIRIVPFGSTNILGEKNLVQTKLSQFGGTCAFEFETVKDSLQKTLLRSITVDAFYTFRTLTKILQ